MRIFRTWRSNPAPATAPAAREPDPAATEPGPATMRLVGGIHGSTRDQLTGHLDVLRYVLTSDPFDDQVIETYITMAQRIGSCDQQLADEIRRTPRKDWPALRTMLAEVHVEALRTGIALFRSLPDPEPEDVEVVQAVLGAMSELTSATARGQVTRPGPLAAPPAPAAVPPAPLAAGGGIAALGTGDDAARDTAVGAAVDLGPPAVAALYGALGNPDAAVREDAHRALVRIGPVDEFFEVARGARFEPIELREEIAAVLGELDDPRAIEALIDIGTTVDSVEVGSRHRMAAADALARIGLSALDRLLGLAGNDVAVEQDLAAGALGRLGDDRAVGALIELASYGAPRHPKPFVRHSAQHALRAITGEDFGDDGAAWRSWLEGRR